jgi:hypothetical protein
MFSHAIIERNKATIQNLIDQAVNTRSDSPRRLLDRRGAGYRGPDVRRRHAGSDADIGMAIAPRPTCRPRPMPRAVYAAPGQHRRRADRSRLGLAHQAGFSQRSIERRGSPW